MDSLRRLEEIFARFPGIGPRQARRFIHHLQSRSPSSISEMIKLIQELKSSSRECSLCHRFYIINDSGLSKSIAKNDSLICNICANTERDHSTLMIVSRDSDFESIEKSGAYNGLYFILGGTVPILDKEPEKKIRLKALLDRVSRSIGKDLDSNGELSVSNAGVNHFSEIILSLNTTPDGDHTTDLVKSALRNLLSNAAGNNVAKITVLGRGLSTGAELEYADGETIKSALGNRK